MAWESDVFTEGDALDFLTFFSPQIVTPVNVKKLTKYLGEIPPPHDPKTYAAYCDQLKATAGRRDRGVDAELWLWALLARALSFEVEAEFTGPIRQLLSGEVPETPAQASNPS